MKCTLLISLFLLCTQAQAQQIKRLDGSMLPVDSVASILERHIARAGVTGAYITIYQNNKPAFSKGYGMANVPAGKPFTDEGVLYGASLAKMVFAYVAAQLIDEKVFHLDTPLVHYLQKPLPDYKLNGFRRGYHDLKNDLRYEQITARMCLSHTTGLPNWRWFEPDKKLKFKFSPGTRYSYSGEGLFLLQFVIEQITKRDYESMVRERVFVPLGMANTSMVWQPRFDTAMVLGHNAAGKPYELMKWKEASVGGSMSTTAADFNLFFTALMQRKGLSRKAFQRLTTPQVRIRSGRQFGPLATVDSTQNDDIQLSYGLGIPLFTTPYGPAFFKEGHDEGWGHYALAFPRQKIGIVILTNNDLGESIFQPVLQDVLADAYSPWRWENWFPYNFTVHNEAPPAAEVLQAATGSYKAANVPAALRVWAQNGMLYTQLGNETVTILSALKNGHFTDPKTEAVYRFSGPGLRVQVGHTEYLFAKQQ